MYAGDDEELRTRRRTGRRRKKIIALWGCSVRIKATGRREEEETEDKQRVLLAEPFDGGELTEETPPC